MKKNLPLLLLISYLAGCTGEGQEAVEDFLDLGDKASNSSIIFTPGTYDFGIVETGQTTANQTFTAQNTSDNDVFISKIEGVGSDFNLVSDSCPKSPNPLGKDQTCNFVVNFAPLSTGKINYSVQFTYGATSDSPSGFTSSMPISGTGLSPLIFAGVQTIGSITNDSVLLGWTANASATAFLVYSAVGTNLTLLQTISNATGTVDQITVASLTPSTAYEFVVRGIDTFGNQDSNTASVSGTTLPNTAPVLTASALGTIWSTLPYTELFDVNTDQGTDLDADSDAVTYSCHYDDVIDASVTSTAPTCDNIVNIDGSNPTFNTTTGALTNYTPSSASETSNIEFVIIGTDPYNAQDNVVLSATIKRGMPVAFLTASQTTAGAAFNQNAEEPISFQASTYDSTHFSHDPSGANPEILRVLVDGDYIVHFNLPMLTVAGERLSTRAQLYVDGVLQEGSSSEPSYIRNTAQDHSTDHINFFLQGLTASQTIEIRVQESARGTASNMLIDGLASLYVEYAGEATTSPRKFFSATTTTTTAGVNINSNAESFLSWTQQYSDDEYAFNAGTPQNIPVVSGGDYLVMVNVPMTSGVQRTQTRIRVYAGAAGGPTQIPGGEARQTYIRNGGGGINHNTSTAHFAGIARGLNPNDVIQIRSIQEVGGAGGNVTIPAARPATLFLERIDTASETFHARTTTLAGGATNFNSAAKTNLRWTTVDINDAATYTLQGGNTQIRVNKAGDYLVMYNDLLDLGGTGTQRMNPAITIEVNGVEVTGAKSANHYARNNGGQSDSTSTSLVFWLQGLAVNDLITISTQRDDVAGTFPADADALLYIIRKRDP